MLESITRSSMLVKDTVPACFAKIAGSHSFSGRAVRYVSL